MTLKKLTVGDGYTYLTRHIAGGDQDWQPGQSAADYYTAKGNPPGRWAGRGLNELGLTGSVSEDQMRHLFGQGMHPDADRIIADYLARHTKAGMTEEQLEKLSIKAVRAATLGRRFPQYQTLEAFDARVEQRLAQITSETGREPTQAETGRIRAEEARRARAGVAGYDLVFTPVKSLVLIWALDERQWVRDAILKAHEQARDSALALLEEHAAYTRAGDTGQAQVDTRGLLYAVFDHYDSRDGDPNLHSHVVVANKIRAVDGSWKSLDGSALYRLGVAASEHYNSTIETLAAEYTGISFAVRPDTEHKKHPVREVLGMPVDYIKGFSARRGRIEARYEQLVVDFRRAYGRDPEKQAAFSLAEQANLDTRGAKPKPRSLAGLRAEWAQRLTAEHGRGALAKLRALVTVSGPDAVAARLSTDLSTADISGLAEQAVGWAEQSRSTWTVWNLRAEADRMLRNPSPELWPSGFVFATADERTRVLEAVVAEAIQTACVPVTVEPQLHEPAMLRRADGVSVFHAHRSARYTSKEILDAEQRLLTAARTPATAGLSALSVHATLDGYEAVHAKQLDEGQRAMVAAFATDPRLITVGLGPAGSGKTTTMHAYQHVLASHGIRLIPLATSAAAAAVLSNDLGTPAENVHKFVYEHLTHGQPQHGHNGKIDARKAFFRINPGDVILVDEAGLAGTRNLDTLRALAEQYGATIRLLGDYRQLSAVESGGALRLIATEVGATELSVLHRFSNPDEAANTLALRDGDSNALDFYADHGRIRGGSAEAMIEQAYNAWHADISTGRKSLMSSATTQGVAALAARARADRVAAGQVEHDGVALHDGNRAGVGDWIVTRDNDRTLTCHRGKDWVRNGESWTVTARNQDGSLRVQHMGHGGTLTLPADYVATRVELLYATTTHRAQGATVDTAHALITDDMTRENLYVAATRAKHCTTLYAVTHRILPLDEDDRLDRTVYDRHGRAAREILETVLANEGTEASATEAIAQAQDKARSLATLLPRLRYSAELVDVQRLADLVTRVLPDDACTVLADPSWPTTMRALRAVEAQGWDLQQVLAGTARRGPLSGTNDPAELLAWRARDFIDGRLPTPALAQPTAADAARYAALVEAHLPATTTPFTADEGVRTPRALHTDPATGRLDYAKILGMVVGGHDAARATTELAWPSLVAAVRRAENAGHDPITVIAQAAVQRPLHDARSVSETLTWRINRQATNQPIPATEQPADAWRALAWTLKAAENNGVAADDLLRTAPTGSDLHALRSHVQRLTAPAPQHGVLPWETPLPAAIPTAFSEHISTTTALVDDRVHELTTRALTEQPAWLAGLGTLPTDPAHAEQWVQAVGIVAAYRDQHHITIDRADQPLGTYIPETSAAHDAYLHAANALLTARHPGTDPADPLVALVTADVYHALPTEQRDQVAQAVAAGLGGDWLGPRHGNADTLLAAPVYTTHLHAEMVRRGLLTETPTLAAKPETAAATPATQVLMEAPMEYHQAQPDVTITY
ncbi:MobF family relaxase [Catelliglobosispora koreensis]|uniref:MobF family relaxase n=1 Tax=Catelliglobosispora koreensis TaxID=129052 RepID=UPI00146B8254|nr:MobF family relaxase [Catelliglobosispora koreensis]